MPEKINYNSFLKNVGWATSASFINQLVGVFFLFVSSRILAPTEYGLMSIILVFTGFSEILVNGGFVSALVQKDQPSQVDYSTVCLVTLVLSIFLTLSTLILAPFISILFKEPKLIGLLRYASLAYLFIPIRIIPLVLHIKNLNYRSISQITLFSNFLSVIVAGVLLYFGWGIWSLVSKYVLQQVFTSLLFWRSGKWKLTLSFELDSLRAIWAFSSQQTLSDAFGYWSRKIDDLLIGKFISSYALGIYSFAYNFLLLPTTLIKGQVVSVIFPTFVKIKDEPAQLKKLYLETSGALALVAFPLILTLVGISKQLVLSLMGSKWHEVIPIINLFCIASLFEVFIIPGALFQAFGRADINLRTTLITKAINVVAILVGLKFGVEFISKLLVIAAIINFFIYGFFVEKFAAIRTLAVAKTALIPLIISISMLGGILTIEKIMGMMTTYPNFILLLIEIVCALLIYIIGLLVLKPPLFSHIIKKYLKPTH